MNSHAASLKWEIAKEGTIQLKTNRIGFMSITAHAPMAGGSIEVSGTKRTLTFHVDIAKVKTGNPLMDHEVHNLVNKWSDGTLTFSGSESGKDWEFVGSAVAGTVERPLTVEVSPPPARDSSTAEVSGTATFEDVKIPLPGLDHVNTVNVHITGSVVLRSI